MKLPIYQIDAFARKLFTGNPAAVVPLKEWIDEERMQKIGMENNLAETAFFVPATKVDSGEDPGEHFDIRWFTPVSEINLCGHATLASAYVLYQHLGYKGSRIIFHSKSGPLFVSKNDEQYFLDFPSWKPERMEHYPDNLIPSLGNPVVAGIYKSRDIVVELENEDAIKRCRPDFNLMKTFKENVIITAPGNNVDFVSRFFGPSIGIDEDPVTGSAHSQLIPLWSYKLGKNKMQARQLSLRGGDVSCEQKGERVIMGGTCAFYMQGQIEV